MVFAEGVGGAALDDRAGSSRCCLQMVLGVQHWMIGRGPADGVKGAALDFKCLAADVCACLFFLQAEGSMGRLECGRGQGALVKGVGW